MPVAVAAAQTLACAVAADAVEILSRSVGDLKLPVTGSALKPFADQVSRAPI